MGDRRVRPNHAARSGLVFKWSNPPDGGHPGQAVRCRCVAQPLIDEQSFKLVPQKSSYTNYAESGKIQVPKGLAAGNIPYVNQSGTPPKLIGYTPDIREDTVRRTLERYEKIIVKSKVENAVIITVKGEIYHCTGDLEGVPSPFFEQLGEKLNNAVVTHNHPIGSSNEYSFSAKDRRLFSDFKLAKLRGVDEKFIYEFDRNSREC